MPGEHQNLDLAGTVLDGRLKLESIIGTGEKCVLYSGTHLLLSKAVAIKVFDKADADVVVRNSEQNMHSSQRLQKLLGTGTKGEVGYAVFDLNTSLTAPDMVRVYGLDELSKDYLAAVDRARATARKGLLWKVIVTPIVVLLVGSVLVTGGTWLTNNLKAANVTPYHQLLADMGTGDSLPDSDLALLETFAKSLGSEKVPMEEAENYRHLYGAALLMGNAAGDRKDGPRMKAAYEAAISISMAPGVHGPNTPVEILPMFMEPLGAVKREDLAKELLDFYLKRVNDGIPIKKRAGLKCVLARLYDMNGKFEEARKLYDAYEAEGSDYIPSAISGAALNAFHLKDPSRQKELTKDSIDWLGKQNSNDLRISAYKSIHRMYFDFIPMRDLDTAMLFGRTLYSIALENPKRVTGMYISLPENKVSDSKAQMHLMMIETALGQVSEQNNDPLAAQAYYRSALKRKMDPGDKNSPLMVSFTKVDKLELAKLTARLHQ